LAALTTIDPALHEAAVVDGANRLQRIWHIDVPGIMPIVMTLLILNMGQLTNVGFEKAFLLQNPLNLATSEVISTYVYKVGLAGGVANFSYAAAIGLFNSVLGLVLLLAANQLSKKFSQNSLF
jgi:putative aldouronate transport system permease protein